MKIFLIVVACIMAWMLCGIISTVSIAFTTWLLEELPYKYYLFRHDTFRDYLRYSFANELLEDSSFVLSMFLGPLAFLVDIVYFLVLLNILIGKKISDLF